VLALTTQNALSQEYIRHSFYIDRAIKRVLRSGRYILGPELERFEQRFAALIGTRYAVGVGNGFDAIYIAVKVSGMKRVYIPNELHISTTNAVILAGGHITTKEYSQIIMPVVSPENGDHSYRDGYIIEDACRAVGMDRVVPKWVAMSCYSFHPLKKFHCYGDGGAIAVNDELLYMKIREFRNHGRVGKMNCYGVGVNSRLDEIQAAVLNVALDRMENK
jgi:dTDP-4-amino-4,6-dideoxygalactose transaminase